MPASNYRGRSSATRSAAHFILGTDRVGREGGRGICLKNWDGVEALFTGHYGIGFLTRMVTILNLGPR